MLYGHKIYGFEGSNLIDEETVRCDLLVFKATQNLFWMN